MFDSPEKLKGKRLVNNWSNGISGSFALGYEAHRSHNLDPKNDYKIHCHPVVFEGTTEPAFYIQMPFGGWTKRTKEEAEQCCKERAALIVETYNKGLEV